MDRLSIKEKAVGAFLGAAVGDALGWPNEDRSHRVRKKEQPLGIGGGFSSWVRRKGFMAFTFEEPIFPGEYSDDTQLILALARSLRTKNWWEDFARVELPSWLLYERGGGIAVKRSAKAWSVGKPPWAPTKESDAYWDAGGNGVCMRILPHVFCHAQGSPFSLSEDIFLNGILTHGHPRALVGATLYGFALWLCIRENGSLRFGGVIDELLRNRDEWARFPSNHREHSWPDHVRGGLSQYEDQWRQVVDEVVQLLEVARSRIERGALETGDEALRDLGAFSKIGGAGTVTACSAIFLASRYASSPKQGIRAAAGMVGTDADTIASMTAAILGAIHGRDCLNSLGPEVQDSKYIESTATTFRSATYKPRTSQVSRLNITGFNRRLKEASIGDTFDFPDGRQVLLQSRQSLVSKRAPAEQFRLQADDGQTLIISMMDRTAAKNLTVNQEENPSIIKDEAQVGVRLAAFDLREAQYFYESVLGLRITASSKIHLEFEKRIFVTATQSFHFHDATRDSAPRVMLRVPDVKRLFSRLAAAGKRPSSIHMENGEGTFCVLDPFGNQLEISGSLQLSK
jgi:ADP-ribosylglycohydrolase